MIVRIISLEHINKHNSNAIIELFINLVVADCLYIPTVNIYLYWFCENEINESLISCKLTSTITIYLLHCKYKWNSNNIAIILNVNESETIFFKVLCF